MDLMRGIYGVGVSGFDGFFLGKRLGCGRACGLWLLRHPGGGLISRERGERRRRETEGDGGRRRKLSEGIFEETHWVLKRRWGRSAGLLAAPLDTSMRGPSLGRDAQQPLVRDAGKESDVVDAG